MKAPHQTLLTRYSPIVSTALGVAAIMSLTASPLPAATIFYTGIQADDSGTGFGTVLNLLTLQNNTSEWGSALYNTLGAIDTLGDAKPNSRIQTVAAMAGPLYNITSGNFGIIFNIAESANQKEVVLNDFSLRFYTNPSNLTVYFDATYTAPVGGLNLVEVGSGTGNAGFLFSVSFTPTEAANFFSNPNNSVGGYVLQSKPITQTSGGQENFFIASMPESAHMPEPSSSLLGLFGACMLCGMRRRR